MGQAKHYFYEYEERESFNDFLKQLVDGDYLDDDDPALGITKKVIAEGRESLSEKQDYVFRTYVLDKFVTEDCSLCGSNIPWS